MFLSFSSSIKSIRYGLTDIVDNIRTHTHTHTYTYTRMQIIYPYPNDHRRNICYPLCTHPLEINFGRRSVSRSFACRSSVSYALASINLLFHNLSPPQFSDLKKNISYFLLPFSYHPQNGKDIVMSKLCSRKKWG